MTALNVEAMDGERQALCAPPAQGRPTRQIEDDANTAFPRPLGLRGLVAPGAVMRGKGATPAGLSGILFIEDFDERPRAGPAAADAPEIIAPGYTADDIEAAREEGRLAALEEHGAIHTGLCTAALAAISDHFANARTEARMAAARNADEITGAMFALLKAALPATAARLAAAEVRSLTDILLPPLAREPGVDVHVHPTVQPFISTSLCDGIPHRHDITIHSDASLAPSDVTITWGDGTARRDWAALWKQISEILAPFSLPDDLRLLMRGTPGANHAE